jgi:hypothetical protein
VPDGHEDAARGDLADPVRLEVADEGARDLRLRPAEDLLDHGVPQKADLGVLERTVLHDLRGPQGVAAVHDRHLLRELGEEGRLLHRGVAASDDQDILALVEEPVTGGAGGDPADARPELELLRKPQPARARAGGDDDRLRDDLALVDVQGERTARKVHLLQAAAGELRGEAFRLPAEAFHHLRPEDALRESGVVVDIGGEHELAARHVSGIVAAAALHDQRLQVRPGGVQGGGQAGGARPEDDDTVLALFRHGLASIPAG